MSVKTMTPERIIEAVINHEFESAQEAMKTCNSIEFSGFGKFCFRKKKAGYKMEKYLVIKASYERQLLDESLTEQKRKTLEIKLASVIKDINLLKPKLQ